MAENLFDLNDLSDLPEDMRKDVESRRLDDFESKILDLFEIANRQLTIDEVMIALFRKFSLRKNRRQVMNKLYQMGNPKTGRLISVKKGVYKLKIEEVDNEIMNIEE